MKKTKKNNKGFSLVELIVVVLIMGIIAVALAPQVMKWVGKARDNSDENTMKDLKSSINIACADAIGEGTTGLATVALSEVSSTTCGASGAFGAWGSFIDEVLGGEYPKDSAGKFFKASITYDDTNNTVTVKVEKQ